MDDAQILIIDDETDTLRLVQAILEDDGFSVISAENGKDGLDAVRGEHPDLVITDVNMPVMDGFELVQRIRSDPLIRATPLIILSARAEEEDKVRGLDLGADDYMTKPFGRKELVAKVRAMIRRIVLSRESLLTIPQGPFANPGQEELRNFTFDTFVVGVGNKTAYEGAKAAAAEPGTRFNPLFFYGGPGLGKTHLMCALANEVFTNNKEARILYLTSEVFSQEILDAYEQRHVFRLRQEFLDADVLIIDDIQFLGISQSMQLVAADILSELYDNGKQIVISSDRKPEELHKLTGEISSSFEVGLVVGVDRPDASLRSRIIKFKAKQRGWDVDDDILEYLAARLESDIRTLDGVAKRLMALKTINGQEIDHSVVDSIVPQVTTAADEVADETVEPESDTPAIPVTEPVEESETVHSLIHEFKPDVPVDKQFGDINKDDMPIPSSVHDIIIVVGTSSPLIIDTVEALAGRENHDTPLPQGDQWTYHVHAKNENPVWALLGSCRWLDDIPAGRRIQAIGPSAVLLVLDGMSPKILETRNLLGRIPADVPTAVVVLVAAARHSASSTTRAILEQSMRRLFRIPAELPVIVSGRVSPEECRRWLNRAIDSTLC